MLRVMAKEKREPAQVFAQWIERDLTQEALRGTLPEAYVVDDVLQQISDLVASGRNPVLTGDSGIGKTAIIYELVRRLVAGHGPAQLQGKHVLQISFRRVVAGLKDSRHIGEKMTEFLLALDKDGGDIVPFFRDVHLAYSLNLESHLETLAFRFQNPVLSEGERYMVDAMFEYTPELEQQYMMLCLEEPDLKSCRDILRLWAKESASTRGISFSDDALEEVLQLSHRFLARSRLPRKALDLLSQSESMVGDIRHVEASHVIERFCVRTRVPRLLVDPDVSIDLNELRNEFSSNVLGQPEAVQAVVDMIGLIKAGLSSSLRPFGAFLFVGPTGIGKTHIAQLLAEYLFGNKDRLLRFNMADFQTEESAHALFGNPNEDRLQHQRGMLTQSIMGQSFGVLLFDELEKAHEKLHDRFLQLIDEGQYINGAAETVSCRSMIIIATSNAGAEVFQRQRLGFVDQVKLAHLDRDVDERLRSVFRVEFLNRFDNVVHFHPLTREDIRVIALRELELLRERSGILRRGFKLEIDDALLDWLTVHGYDPHYGARFLRRVVERNVTTTLAEYIVRREPKRGSTISLTVRANRVVARSADVAKPSSVTEEVVLPAGAGQLRKKFDEKNLLEEAHKIVASSAVRLQGLEAKRQQASALLARTNEEGFWDRSQDSSQVLETYRALDVAIQVESRFAKPLQRLQKKLEEVQSGDELTSLARIVEVSARVLHEWETRIAEEGDSSLWILIANVDPLSKGSSWVQDIVQMELRWCREQQLQATVVGYVADGHDVSAVGLEVEGPGGSAYLSMEQGLHRLVKEKRSSMRVQVDVIPKGGVPNGHARVTSIRETPGLFHMVLRCEGRAEERASGRALVFCGDNVALLNHFVVDLEGYWANSDASGIEIARVYGDDTGGVRDPRTGVSVPRLKDVFKGRLHPFLEGWRRKDRVDLNQHTDVEPLVG